MLSRWINLNLLLILIIGLQQWEVLKLSNVTVTNIKLTKQLLSSRDLRLCRFSNHGAVVLAEKLVCLNLYLNKLINYLRRFRIKLWMLRGVEADQGFPSFLVWKSTFYYYLKNMFPLPYSVRCLGLVMTSNDKPSQR